MKKIISRVFKVLFLVALGLAEIAVLVSAIRFVW